MELTKVIEEISNNTGGFVGIFEAKKPCAFDNLVSKVQDFKCTNEQFKSSFRSVSKEEAKSLLSATFHQTLAYSEELIPIDKARLLASEFIFSAGESAKYFSNCFSDDDVNGVGVWNSVTDNTFESVLYCETTSKCILVFAVDED